MRTWWILSSALLLACSSDDALIDAGEDASDEVTIPPDAAQDTTVNDVAQDTTVNDVAQDTTVNDVAQDTTVSDVAQDTTMSDAGVSDAGMDVTDSASDAYDAAVACNPDAMIADAETVLQLASQQINVNVVAVDGTNAYWGELNSDGGGAVRTCALDGCDGGPTTLVPPTDAGLEVLGAVAVHGSTLYWSRLGAVMSCTLPDCSNPAPFVTGQSAARIVVDSANVYWTDYIYGAVRQCAISGCNNNPTTLASNQSLPWAIAVDGTNVYWTSSFTQIWACAIGGCGGTPTLLVSGLQASGSVATDGNDVYFTNGGGIYKCAVTGCGGNPTPVIAAGAVTLALDGTELYWTNGSTAEIRKCPLADCCGGVTVLAANQPSTVYGIAVNDASVCWSTYAASGTIAVATPK